MKITLNSLLKTAMLVTLGIVLPMAFHAFGWSGRVFLPMHIPVLLAGFLLGPLPGAIAGATTPLLSSVLTGMPPMAPMPIALQMSIELAAFGLLAGIFLNSLKLNIFLSLVLTLAGGRLALGLTTMALFPLLGLPAVPLTVIFGASLVTALPGLVLQIIAIPPIVLAMKKYNMLKHLGAS
ncbi:MAG: hypothetical protein DDT34_00596 [Firmicutes bacterium]|nr:hypothetical protein [Bacillota bacterium]MBT9157706.1 hypothetical protein [Bacillota bacterium]